jgi:mono/diheme cytochrome c family protein
MTRFNIQLFAGLFLTLLLTVAIIIYGLNEETRMANYAKAEKAQAIEVGAKLYADQCSRCHGPQGLGIQGLCPPLNDRYFFDQRLKDVGWVSTMEDYIVTTATSGRLVSTRPQLYPGNASPPSMPAFGDTAGGPLRQDQLRAIAQFIINWEPGAQEISALPTPAGPPVGTDITKQLPEGNVQSGEALAIQLACTACHELAPTGPAWSAVANQPGIGDRAALRIEQDDYTGNATTPEEYLFESVVDTNIYIVEGFAENVMPATYGSTLTDQNMADLIAYMLSIK